MASEFVERMNAYAKAAVDGEIVACQDLIKACQRHFDDLKNGYYLAEDEDKNEKIISVKVPIYFNEDAADKACRFIELLPHIKGPKAKAGESLYLEDWQIFIVCSIFGWFHVDENVRRFTEAYIKVARKNGKTTLAAAIGVYMLSADGEEGAEVLCGATSRDQALEIFDPARAMIEKEPDLANHFGIEVNKRSIYIPATNSKFIPIVGDPGDGANPSCSITDEYHEHRSSDQYDTMVTGMGSREQPLAFVITTAGEDISGPCYDMEQAARDTLNGLTMDGRKFAVMFNADPSDKWDSMEALLKANPNYGVSVREDYLKGKLQEARTRVSRRNLYKTKHLGMWVSAMAAFFDLELWMACGSDDLKIEDYKGRQCFMALDLATNIDPACLLIAFPPHGEYKDWGIFPKFYLPEKTVEDPKNRKWKAWADQDYIVVTPGPRIDYDYIEEDIEELCAEYNPTDVAYDIFQATQLAGHMVKKGIEMVQYNHIVKNMSEPMKFLETIISKRLVRHDNNPLMNWMMSNVVAKIDRKDNVFPNKNKPELKIDGAVCLIMAVGRSIVAEDDNKPSVYEDRGITVI